MNPLFSGRLGRVRYFALRSAILLLAGLVFIGLGLLTGVLPPAARPFMGLLILLVLFAALLLYAWPAVRRAHDFNMSGWLALLSLVPLVNLLFWFVPGTVGGNRYGEPTPVDGRAWVVAAIVLPLLSFVLFLFLVVAVVIQYQMEATGRAAGSGPPPVEEQPDPEQ
jgi:uncharacterized membrane protein YhaH (DUF805 family)